MELLLLSRVYWVAAALFVCFLAYGFISIVVGVIGSSEVQALLHLIPAAVLIAIAIVGAILSLIVYNSQSRVTVGICLALLLFTTCATLVTTTIAQDIGKKSPA